MSSFTFNGRSSEEFGLVVERIPRRYIPRRRVTSIEIPGRSGVLHQSDGSYENYPRVYRCWFAKPPVPKDVYSRIHDIAEWLGSAPSGSRLEDSYDTRVWHRASYLGGADVEVIRDRHCRFDVEFDLDPRGFLVSHDLAFNITSTGLINNPTTHTSFPLIEVDSNGALGGVIRIDDSDVNLFFGQIPATTIYIDCEIREAWYVKDGVRISCNQVVTSTKWPQLDPGSHSIAISGIGIDRARVYGRVWKL